ncbi:rRNA-binding ribosome biosynthesis protein [Coemansia erecta]|uniref:rRNA-binding ribosome biosynthesis protein n=1 Tax=Coemansia erecta TaxID=147472 RepID=A0A9W7Y4T9_9FUNG|nr:rRNA-binding ribosome biosynthesis protein [Coemansia erecta]
MGHGRKKRRTHVALAEEDLSKTPRALVVKSGHVGTSVARLVHDVRKVMEPNTASNLKERVNNRIKDYVAVSAQLGISHILMFSQTDAGTNLRIARIPRGPTLYFKVNSYALTNDCLKLQKSPFTANSIFKSSPLIILNNFAGADKGKELKLMTAMLQNMFPAINPSVMHLSDARRVVLFNYNDATGMVDFRHYTVVVKPVGVTKGVKRVILAKNIPSMAGFDDISEYVLREAFASESDVEDGPENEVTLPQDYVGRNNRKNEQRAVRLQELGPRMELCLMKVEAGLCEGDVLYHKYVSKTKEELEKAARLRQIKMTNQARRRQEQEAHVKRKKGQQESDDESEAESDAEDRGGESDDSDGSDSKPKKVAKKAGKARLVADDFGADEYSSS